MLCLAANDGAPVTIADLTMEEEAYRRKGLAAVVAFQGQIEGRIVLDMDPGVAAKVAGNMSGGEVDPSEPIVPETICELANMVIGNAVTQFERSRLAIQSFAAFDSHRRAVRKDRLAIRKRRSFRSRRRRAPFT